MILNQSICQYIMDIFYCKYTHDWHDMPVAGDVDQGQNIGHVTLELFSTSLWSGTTLTHCGNLHTNRAIFSSEQALYELWASQSWVNMFNYCPFSWWNSKITFYIKLH